MNDTMKKKLIIILIVILVLAGFGFNIKVNAAYYYIQSKLSDTANSVESWGEVSSLSSETNTNDNVYGSVVPLSNGDMYATYVVNTTIYGIKYTSGSGWGSAAEITTSGKTGLANNLSVVSDSNGYIHLTYIDSSNYVKYQEYTTSWQTAVTLDSTATNEYCTLAIDTAGNNGLYAFWIRDNNIYYRRGCSPYESSDWDSATTFESAGGNSNDWSVAGYEDFGSGKIFAEWTQGSASPYSIKWKSLTPTTCTAATITVSGYMYENFTPTKWDECDGSTENVKISIESGTTYTTTCNTDTGYFEKTEITIPAADKLVSVYMEGETEDGVSVTLPTDTTSDIAINVYKDTLRIESVSGTSVTNAKLAVWDSGEDTDVLYTVDGSNNLSTASTVKTYINTGDTYAPGANVSTGYLEIVGTYTGASETLTLSGSGTGTSRPLYINSGTFSANTNTTVFTGSSESDIQETAYNNLELKPAGNATYHLATTGSQTITINGNLTVGNETNTPTIDWTTYDPGITLKGSLDLNSPSVWTKSDTATLTWTVSATKTWSDDNATKQDIGIISITGGSSTPIIQLSTGVKATTLAVADAQELALNSQNLNITNGALTTASTGTITCASCSAGTTTILGTGNLGGGTGAITFYNLSLGDDTETGTTTAASDFTVNNVLTIAGGSNNHVFDASNKTITLAGSSTTFVVNGTFTYNTSTIKYTGTLATNITSTIYYNLEFVPASGSPNYTILGNITANNNVTIGDGTNAVTLKADTNNPILNFGNSTLDATSTFLIKNNASFVGGSSNLIVYGDLTINSGADYTKGTGTLIFDGGDDTYPRYFTDSNGIKENMGTVQIGTSPAVTKLKSDMTADSLTVSSGDTLKTQGWDLNIATFITVNGILDCTESDSTNGTNIYLGTDWTVDGSGTFTAQESETYPTTVIFDETGAGSLSPGGTDENHDFYNLQIAKSSANTITLSGQIDVENDLSISNSNSTLDSANYAIYVGGSWSNSGTFTSQQGSVYFDSADTGETIDTGGTGAGQTFYNIFFNNSNGGWTISNSDLKATNHFHLLNLNTFDASNRTITVQGTFNNNIGGSGTTWTGSTLVLDGSGSYCINATKNVGGDVYNIFNVSAGQYIRMWDSSASTYNITGTLYSMDHGANDGYLYIWGAYAVPDSATDYWSYAKDFDSAAVTRQCQVTIQSGASITVGSGENLEIKGEEAASSDKTTITYAPASGSWNFNNDTGSELIIQEAKVDYMKVNSGTVTALNTVLDSSSEPVAPAAGAYLNSDWYVGVHLVDVSTLANIQTGSSTDVVISENSGTPQSTVWKYSSGSWGSASTYQETGTGSDGKIPQPGTDGAIRIREYSRTSTGYTFCYYNLYVKWQSNYGEYNYYEWASDNKYVISNYYSGGGQDNVIGDSGSYDWHREDIDSNNTEPLIDDPPTYGTFYCGLRPGLDFEIVDSDTDDPPTLELGLLEGPNFTSTDWLDLKIATSASHGYIVTSWALSDYTPNVFRHTQFPSTIYIDDFSGTYSTPLEWSGYCKDNSSYCGFGYTSNDPLVEGSNRYNSGSNYAKLASTGPGNIISDYSQPVSKTDTGGTYRMTVKASVLSSQLAGNYSTTLIFICTANY